MWVPWSGPGLEHLRLALLPGGGSVADGLVVGLAGQRPFRARYAVRCDDRWRARELRVEVLDSGRPPLILFADGEGRWTAGGGNAVPALDGCLDVDIAVTPYTNTLPIRRLALAAGEATELRVAYISVPELCLTTDPQRYTCLAVRPAGGLYRYQSLAGDFTADLPIDADGLVIDYPHLFRRVWSR